MDGTTQIRLWGMKYSTLRQPINHDWRQQWLCENVPEFIKHEQWPSGSPDLNPLDYQLWYDIEEDACSRPHTSLKAPKCSIQRAVANLPHERICACIDQWPDRLRKTSPSRANQRCLCQFQDSPMKNFNIQSENTDQIRDYQRIELKVLQAVLNSIVEIWINTEEQLLSLVPTAKQNSTDVQITHSVTTHKQKAETLGQSEIQSYSSSDS
ncbi:hypothetical protein V9T40_006006 [Parthenolecanium corni]|uniref:Uncharacterized protein n=1 Tax=Parthenolecanium corni TaxID=536013 RepID=A0AAN9YBI0_9HEMI